LAGVAQAGKPVSASPVKGAKVNPAVVLTAHKLISTALSPQGVGGGAPPGFAAVDAPQTISCKTHANCTIEAIMMVQFDSGEGGATPGPWAICLSVDGNFNACPYMDDGHNNGFFTAATATGFATGLAAGTHTVQTFLYTSSGTTIFNFDIAYHSYT
jgi:hypothetical protein